MQTTERPPTGPTRGTSPVRGVVLVAVAVVLGFFVLRAIDDTGGAPGAATDTETTAGGASQDSETPPETEPAPQPRPPGEVVVLVANASGVSGAAGAQRDILAGAGYQTLEPTNATEELEATQVLSTPGFEADAAALAAQLGVPESVQALPDPPPIDPAGANVIVLLGLDLAGG
jgi:hypothetical protein